MAGQGVYVAIVLQVVYNRLDYVHTTQTDRLLVHRSSVQLYTLVLFERHVNQWAYPCI